MTEAEWLTCADSVPLVEYWGEPYPERKSRLLMLACCLLRKRYFAHAAVREGVKALEKHYADPLAPDRPFEGREYLSLHARIDRYTNRIDTPRDYHVALGVFTAIEPASVSAKRHLMPFGVNHCLQNTSVDAKGKTLPAVRAAQADLVREIFGNPFRPITFSPAWRTDTALTLTRQMYESRDFSAMPILADALQDAGCDNDDILSHCRGAGPHVRGCWVVDLVLGKS
jgi:hypothetical protein